MAWLKVAYNDVQYVIENARRMKIQCGRCCDLYQIEKKTYIVRDVVVIISSEPAMNNGEENQ